MQGVDRRQFLKLAGVGGVVFASGLARGADPYAASQDEFFFVQLSDTHIGFQGAPNPAAQVVCTITAEHETHCGESWRLSAPGNWPTTFTCMEVVAM